MASNAARQKYRDKNPEKDRLERRAAKARYKARHPERYADQAKRSAAKHRAKYPERVKARLKKWASVNARKLRCANLVHSFNITADEWDEKFEAQGRKCDCCGSETPKYKKGWQTDHCHFTGELRGIICGPCNRTLTEHFQLNSQKLVSYIGRYAGAALK